MLEFPKYVDNIISNRWKSEEKSIDYLFFTTKGLSYSYKLVFETYCFFLKIETPISDEKHPDMREKFYKTFEFLFTDIHFYSRSDAEIILRYQVPNNLIERAEIIFSTERWMHSYFFPETKKALDEIVSNVFKEFEEVIVRFTNTPLYENSEEDSEENYCLPCFIPISEMASKYNEMASANNDPNNPYNLPWEINIFYQSYQRQSIEKIERRKLIPNKKKSWIKITYLFLKKIGVIK